MKSTNSHKIKLATAFLFVAVLLQIIVMKVEADCSGPICTTTTNCVTPCECNFTDAVLGVKRCCKTYDLICDPLNKYSCCDGLKCLEVSPGEFKCKDRNCEEHVNHECYPGIFECCEGSGLTCISVGADAYECQ
ncbi:uncharacterized protein [Spinacia oleracea]|uniref:Uncharacterized protein n=1 Tax=Spinacia oleracea TaxID=3562 RepID=A0ABM3RJ51_SPIOL|nr:uncharacterized protein LOC130470070 [Spinacia oleracea]